MDRQQLFFTITRESKGQGRLLPKTGEDLRRCETFSTGIEFGDAAVLLLPCFSVGYDTLTSLRQTMQVDSPYQAEHVLEACADSPRSHTTPVPSALLKLLRINEIDSIFHLASSPGSPIFSTHARKEGEPGI